MFYAPLVSYVPLCVVQPFMRSLVSKSYRTVSGPGCDSRLGFTVSLFLFLLFCLLCPVVLQADATPTGKSYLITYKWGGAWQDAEKSPINSEDDLMCWAAAAANILYWTGWGNVLDGIMHTVDQIFQYFQDHWTCLLYTSPSPRDS